MTSQVSGHDINYLDLIAAEHANIPNLRMEQVTSWNSPAPPGWQMVRIKVRSRYDLMLTASILPVWPIGSAVAQITRPDPRTNTFAGPARVKSLAVSFIGGPSNEHHVDFLVSATSPSIWSRFWRLAPPRSVTFKVRFSDQHGVGKTYRKTVELAIN